MTSEELQQRKKWATLGEFQSKNWVEIESIWHRLSDWRGLRPGEGIPDDQRLARTWCGIFVPRGSLASGGQSAPDGVVCNQCVREYKSRR